MKKLLSILLALTLLLSLCACGASTNADAAAGDSNNGAYDMPEASPMEPGFDYVTDSKAESESPAPVPSPTPDSGAASGETGSTLPENVKMIYRGYLSLESTAFDQAAQGLTDLVNRMGGYFETSELNNYSHYRSAYYVVRVPSSNYNSFCTQLGTLAQLNSQRHTTENISEAYYDTESRLVTQRTKLERLQALLAQADKMEDIITLESAIAETELQIERLTGTLRQYDSLVDYATVTIDLQEVYELTEQEEPVIGFGAKLVQAFKTGTSRFVDDVQDFALDFARSWVGSLIWLIILAVIIVLVVRVLKKRRGRSFKKTVTPPPPPPEKKDEP